MQHPFSKYLGKAADVRQSSDARDVQFVMAVDQLYHAARMPLPAIRRMRILNASVAENIDEIRSKSDFNLSLLLAKWVGLAAVCFFLFPVLGWTLSGMGVLPTELRVYLGISFLLCAGIGLCVAEPILRCRFAARHLGIADLPTTAFAPPEHLIYSVVSSVIDVIGLSKQERTSDFGSRLARWMYMGNIPPTTASEQPDFVWSWMWSRKWCNDIHASVEELSSRCDAPPISILLRSFLAVHTRASHVVMFQGLVLMSHDTHPLGFDHPISKPSIPDLPPRLHQALVAAAHTESWQGSRPKVLRLYQDLLQYPPAAVHAGLVLLGLDRLRSNAIIRAATVDAYGELYTFEANQNVLMLLRVLDPASPLPHVGSWIPVPRHLSSATEAVAWTFGKEAEAYHPMIET